ncbi:MAG: hypothetical protein RBT75_03340 [Anaerolineae bacterium]|jgi:hypothetical protein|nr:hypothetical protein [Anaerolineae bacterium]
MSVARFLLALCCLAGLSACAGAAAPQDPLVGEITAWWAAHALPDDIVAVQGGTALQALLAPYVPTLPLEGGAVAVLAALQEARPAYYLASRGILWDGLQAQPWFAEHYQPVLVSADAHVGFSPLTLYRFASSPFDGGETIAIAAQVEDPAVGVLRVEAARLSQSRPKRSLWPGEPLYLTLTLQGDVREPLRAVLTLRALADERVLFQVVHEQPGGIPTVDWFPGRPVEDRYVILPPADLAPGEVALELAWFRPNGAPFGESITLAQLTRPAEVTSTAQTPDHALGAAFGDSVALLGYDAPVQVAPGQTFTVTLHWQALAPVPTDYKVFVHIFAPGGVLVAQHDGQPVNWTYPTTVWQAGDFILDRHPLTLNPELPRGDYQIFVGFYDAAAPDVRLPAFDAQGAPLADGHVQLATLRVR